MNTRPISISINNDEFDLIEAGKRHILQKEYLPAEEIFNGLIKSNPNSAEAFFELGKIYYIQEKYSESIEKLKKAIILNQDNVFAHLLLAKSYRAKEKYEKAIEEFQKTLELDYRTENIHIALSAIYSILNKFDLAVSELRKALETGYDTVLYNKALEKLHRQQIRLVQAYNFEGRYSEVIKEAQNASSLISKENLTLQNILVGEKELAGKKVDISYRIRSVTVTLTNRCNLACLMCQTRSTPWDLPQKVALEIVSIFPHLERIMWQGGEAFLYDGFKDLMIEASRFPYMRQVIATNGFFIDEGIAEIIVKGNVELTFSIDGATKEVYEHIRRGAKFETVLEKVNLINALRERFNPGMETRLNVLIMRANYHQIEEFLDFAKKYKFNTLFFNAAGCDFKNLSENIFYYNQDKEVINYINKIRDRVTKMAKEYKIRLENWLPSSEFFEGEKNSHKASEVKSNEKLFCHAPWQRLYIDCGGNARPDCICPVENAVGNVLKNTIEEIWFGERMREYRRRIVGCDYQDFCNPDCILGRVPEKNLKYI